MQIGLKPKAAVDLLRRFKEQLKAHEYKLEMCRIGEELFGLKPAPFQDIIKVRKDINLIDQLYALYLDAEDSFHRWEEMYWNELGEIVDSMNETINGYDARCRKLPVKLREWPAYDHIRSRINDYQVLIPLVGSMSKPSIKPRHWMEINSLIGSALAYDSEDFSLAHILNTSILLNKEDVEEICLGADKQLQLEIQINDLKSSWSIVAFEFTVLKSHTTPILKGFGPIVEGLEEAQMLIQSILSVRHVAPFREELLKLLGQLSETSDILELWIKVQMLWASLESVFLGGDISKQMPQESAKFKKTNKEWEKLMVKARETKLVVLSCSNENLKSMLPVNIST
jgi:dynein heavy chain